MAQRYDIAIDAGADFALDVQWRIAPTVLGSAYTAGASTLTVVSTDGAGSTGTVWVQPTTDPPNTPPPGFYLTYTGKTPTTFTGCSATGQNSTTAINAAQYAPVEVVQTLTGYVARMSLRRAIEDAAATLALTSSPAAGLTVTAATGTVSIAITAAQSAALSGTYLYDLEVESSGGTITRLIQGRITVAPQVTY